MPDTSYEIRLCTACGLRYPLLQGHPFGTRCPACMGDTRLLLSRQLNREPASQASAEQMDSARKEEKGKKKEERKKTIAVLMDNVRSGWNVGSILRSADGFGFTHAYLCGITPTADHETVTKTALGAENSVPWSYHKDAVRLVKGLRAEGWQIFALEDDPRAVSISQFPSHRSERLSLLIVGNEVTGVDPGLLDLCDGIFYIPMLGEKKSFNVAIAFSIAGYGTSTGF